MIRFAIGLMFTILTGNAALAQDVAEPLPDTDAAIIEEFAIDKSDRMTVQVQVNEPGKDARAGV